MVEKAHSQESRHPVGGQFYEVNLTHCWCRSLSTKKTKKTSATLLKGIIFAYYYKAKSTYAENNFAVKTVNIKIKKLIDIVSLKIYLTVNSTSHQAL